MAPLAAGATSAAFTGTGVSRLARLARERVPSADSPALALPAEQSSAAMALTTLRSMRNASTTLRPPQWSQVGTVLAKGPEQQLSPGQSGRRAGGRASHPKRGRSEISPERCPLVPSSVSRRLLHGRDSAAVGDSVRGGTLPQTTRVEGTGGEGGVQVILASFGEAAGRPKAIENVSQRDTNVLTSGEEPK